MEPHDRNTSRETLLRSRTSMSKRRLAMRMIRDPLQGMVLIYQLEPTSEEHEPPVLIMETSAWCVKLTDYPSNWRELKDADLLRLRLSDVANSAP